MPLEPKRSTFQDKAQALRRALGNSGYDPRDFDIEADRTSPLAALFQLTGGLVIVRRRSTGEERAYATDAESAWLQSVMFDLSQGRLADAPETAPVILTMTREDGAPGGPNTKS